MPVAEALQLGTPVIATDLPVYREFAGDIPSYLDAIDGAGWTSAIVDFTGDSLERKRQLQAMQGYKVPDWKSHFDKVQEWLAAIDGGIDPP
jgi:glycosyltransferase involved in cell wall biosynthesis